MSACFWRGGRATLPESRPSFRERVAYHEAGHAVAGYLFGRRVSHIRLAREGRIYGQTFYADQTEAELNAIGPAGIVRVAMAGPAAEKILTGRLNWVPLTSDMDGVRDFARLLVAEDEIDAYLVSMIDVVADGLKVDATWQAVEAGAMTLLECGELSGDDLDHLIGSIPQGTDQGSPQARHRQGLQERK